MPAYIKTQDGNITLILGNKNYSICNSHPNYSSIIAALKSGECDRLEVLLDVPKTITARMGSNGVTVEDGQVFYRGNAVHNAVCDRILSFISEGLPHMPLMRFLENLMQNPSSRAVNELYDFLEHKGFPITEDGCFIGYKGIRSDWMDCYSGTINNAVGQKPAVARNAVDDNREHECSWGLHVGTMEYARGYSNQRIVLVKVNPRDAVSVPKDHDASKLRVCSYEVIAEAPQERIDTPMYPMPAASEYDQEEEPWNEGDGFDCDENCTCSLPDCHAEEPNTLMDSVKAALGMGPKRPPCHLCGAKGGKRHASDCPRSSGV